MPTATTFVQGLFDPRAAVEHLAWVLLVLAMLMGNLVWLRTLAIAAALLIVVVGAVAIYNPVDVVWGLALALVNLLQLVLHWLRRRHPRASGDEHLLLERLVPELKPGRAEPLLDRVEWREVEMGDTLVAAGAPVNELMLIAEGAARVEHEGRIVAVLSRGDFADEQSFVSGAPAPVAIIAAKPMKLACLARDELEHLTSRSGALQRALATRFEPPAASAAEAEPAP